MLTLRDGRRLAYTAAGPEDGLPLVYLHGAIGTALAIGDEFERFGLRCVFVNRPGFGGSERAPGRTMLGFADDVEQVADALGLIRRHPSLLARAMVAGAPACDRRQLKARAAREAAAEQFLAAARGGARGLVEDYALSARPWGFALAGVRPEVHVFHGVRDALVPVDHALALAAGLPRCQAWMDPDEGHFLFRRKLADVLAAVTAAAVRS